MNDDSSAFEQAMMKNEKNDNAGRTGTPAKNSGKDPRQDRLKLALRENLKRRKSQARARHDVATTISIDGDLPLGDDGKKKPSE